MSGFFTDNHSFCIYVYIANGQRFFNRFTIYSYITVISRIHKRLHPAQLLPGPASRTAGFGAHQRCNIGLCWRSLMRLLTGDARRGIVNGHKKPLFSGRYVTFGIIGRAKPLFSGRLWINNDMNI